MPENAAAFHHLTDRSIPPEPKPMQEKKTARYNPSDRKIRPQAEPIYHHVHIYQIHANSVISKMSGSDIADFLMGGL
jgi:hypothetical protein